MSRSRKLVATVAAIGVLAIEGCGGDESPTKTTTPTPSAAKKKQERVKKMDPGEVAHAYAIEVSGGKYEYGGLSAAAESGCLEGLLGEHVGPPGVSYQDEFPEPELQAVYEKALKDCT